MPFPTPSTFPQLLRDFTEHWKQLNALLPPDAPLLVLENLPVAALESLGAQLAEAEAGHDPRQAVSRQTRAAVQAAKDALRVLARDFNAWMRANFPGRPETRALAAVVGRGVGTDEVRGMARETLALWRRIAALPPVPHVGPPVLRGGIGVEDGEAALERLEAAVDAHTDAKCEEALALAEAVVLRAEIVAVTTAYGHAVQGRLRAGDRRRGALPELWHPGGREPRRA